MMGEPARVPDLKIGAFPPYCDWCVFARSVACTEKDFSPSCRDQAQIRVIRALAGADAAGYGPMVNALRALGRRCWPANLYW